MNIVTYVTFSELYDREPVPNELLALVRGLDRERATEILIRMNLALRYVMHNDDRNFGRLQSTLAATFCDDDTLQRYRERFAYKRPEEKPLFIPIHCLSVLRLTVAEADKKIPAPTDEALQHLLGRSCLMMANFLFTKEERQQVEQQQNSETKRLTLLVQALAPFELSNPVSTHRMVIRFQQMYRTVLQMATVCQRIKTECNSFDFDEVFKKITNVSLERWLHSIFAIYAYYLQSADPLHSDERYFVIDPDNFTGTSDLSKAEATAILATITSSLDDLKKRICWREPHRP